MADGFMVETDYQTWLWEKLGEKCVTNLKKHDLDAHYFPTGEEARKFLNVQTPCAGTGVCSDCNVPQRICRVTAILHRRPVLTDTSVVLIGEAMGM